MKLLKKSYYNTIKELLKLCIANDSISKSQGSSSIDPELHLRVLKKIRKLTTDKINVGSLMRIVRSQRFERLSTDLSEIEAVKKRVHGIKKFAGHLNKSRDSVSPE